MKSTVEDKNTPKGDELKTVKAVIDNMLMKTYKCAKQNLKPGGEGNIHDRYTLHGVRVDVEQMKKQVVVALPLMQEEIICKGVLCRDITIDKNTGKKSNRYGDQKCEFYIVPNDSRELQNGTSKAQKESYISIGDDWRTKVKEIFDQVFHVVSLQSEHPFGNNLVERGTKTGSSSLNIAQSENHAKIIDSSERRGANRPTEMLYEYWVEGKRIAHPRHASLQNAFVVHLESQGILCNQNTPEYIDVFYKNKDVFVIAEVKPAENVGTKYAIRAAVGQLFEYRYTFTRSCQTIPRLHIVVDKKPEENEIEFVKSLGMILTYKDDSGEFVTIDNAPCQ